MAKSKTETLLAGKLTDAQIERMMELMFADDVRSLVLLACTAEGVRVAAVDMTPGEVIRALDAARKGVVDEASSLYHDLGIKLS